MPRLPLTAEDVYSKRSASGEHQAQRAPAVKLMHAHTTNTQQQPLLHCQALGNPGESLSYPQMAHRQSLKAANKKPL